MKAKTRSIEQIIEEQDKDGGLHKRKRKKRMNVSLSLPSPEKPEVVGTYWPNDFPISSNSIYFIRNSYTIWLKVPM